METGLVSIDFIGKYYSVNIDIEVVKRQYSTGPELSIEEIQRILKDNGFRVKHKVFDDIDKVWKYPMPFIFRTKKGVYNIFLKTDKEDKFLILDCTEKTTKELNKERILEIWDGNIVIFYPRFTETIIFLNFKWLFNEFFRFKSIFSEAILSSFLIQLFGLVSPLFIQLIIDKVLTHQALSTLKVIAGAFLIIIIFDTGLNLFRNYILYHTANKIDSRLGSKVYRHLLSLPYMYFETRKIGTIIARVRELENLRQFMTNISLTVLLDSIFAMVFIAIMCVYSLQLTLITLIFLILIAIISIFATPIIKAKLDDKFQKGAVSQSFLVESITGVQTVKALAIEGKMIKDWENNLGNYINSAFKLSNVGNITFGFSQMLQKLMTLAIIYFGVSYVFSNKLSVGQLIAFQMFAGQLSGPILRLVHSWQDFQQAKLSMERLGDIINTPSEITKGDVTVSNLRGEIVLKDISFKYRQDGPMILNNISFGIPQGTMIGIVGRSGSGKSTVAKLIQKIYLPLEGSIFIDKIDIRNINPILLRYKIGVVLQDNFLFSGTIKENLSLASPNASMENIIRCSQLAGSHNFITEMPMGYETQIEEGGRSLSGGQKQRIAIARALLTNPKILIFDEATSALDYESEKIVLKNLNLIKKNKTVVIIAHRLAVMKNCDFVIVLDKGRIVEVGKHDELLNKNGLYAFLYKQQEE